MSSIPKSDNELKLLKLCEKPLATLGFRAVEVDCVIAGRSLIRIFAEKLSTGEGATLDECAEISRLLGPILDTTEGFMVAQGRYDLEVSSPGLDRRLRTTEDFQKNVGEEIRFLLKAAIPMVGAKPHGRLQEVTETGMTARIDGKDVFIPMEQIKKANRMWNFGKA